MREQTDVSEKVERWIKKHLSEIMMRTVIRGYYPPRLDVTCGVAQGSVLVLVVLVYTNDIPKGI